MNEQRAQLEQVVSASALLGYVNFSDGRPEPRWQAQLNTAYAFLASRGEAAPWQALLDWLGERLPQLRDSGAAAFRDVSQAEAVLAQARQVLPAYRRFHADLLAHLSDQDVFGPFFLVRVLEAILAQRAAGIEEEQMVSAVVARLNDFVGHRPVAILETRPQGEPYEHERHRPLPVFLRGAGVAWGPYHDLIERALGILAQADRGILAEAQLDLSLLDELAIDLRAYDHGHPVNRRPNYVFGEWDPYHLDNQGRFRRYVVRKITLDALMARIEEAGTLDRDERLFEGAAVLAGTILMAVGVSGNSPTSHDSATTLSTLLPRIARYRDAFYEQMLKRMEGPHAARLRQEQATTRQAFGAARQYLNAYLARHRAAQLQQRYLALLFAEMGYAEASREEARRIPAVSMRLLSEILARLTSGQVETRRGELATAAARLPEVEDLLQRGIACGAFADPWNILGFQGLFPLSPAREDSIRDPRLEELVQVVEQIFNLYARLSSEAAAAGRADLVQTLTQGLERLASWWDRFATADVSDVRRVLGREAASSAREVSTALARWHERGESTADLAFWRAQVGGFRSPKAYALVVDALLAKGDYRAAMALLISWLGQAEQVPLEDGIYSFHALTLRWMLALGRPEDASSPGLPDPEQRRQLIVKFFDYLEANAEDYWQVPTLEVHGPPLQEEAEEDIYQAAYDQVVYEDSTAGPEGEVVGDGPAEDPFDLEEEGERLERRLRFLSTLARLWQVAVLSLTGEGGAEARRPVDPWLQAAQDKLQRLLSLLDAIHLHPLREPVGDYDSLVEFDRRRVLKEQLLYTIIATCLDMELAVSALQGAHAVPAEGEETAWERLTAQAGEEGTWRRRALRLERALHRGDPAATRAALADMMAAFQSEPLLFTPLTEGGQPRQILRARLAQTVLRALLANLPRLGLLRETYDLLQTARSMEQTQSIQGRGVTEFNHFFQSAFQSVVESVLEASTGWGPEHNSDAELVEILERLTGPFLGLWIEHSRTLQLSVLETLTGDSEWRALVGFVKRYGGELFHARFMTMGNLRGILHRGVGHYLDYLREHPDPLKPMRLLNDLGRDLRREDAIRRLQIVLQTVVENYEEYKDYNTTTTQSDYGENLHVFLELLRLKAAYDRQAWQLRPLILAHEVLARRGRTQAAMLWEALIHQLTRDLAKQHLEQLARLEQTHGVRLRTISDRLQERFTKPLAQDRLCALIEPAMREARTAGPQPAFEQLRQELHSYTATPVGVGLDVPQWLRRLEMEVHRVQAAHTTIAVLAESFFRVPRRPLGYEELLQQLRGWEKPSLPR